MTTISVQNCSARKPFRHRLPDDRVGLIRKLRASGLSYAAICKQTGHGRKVVYDYAKEIRLPFGPLKRGSKPKLGKTIARKLHSQGLTMQAIADRLGVGKSTVFYALRGRAA